ncbi:MAG: hypothetical protein ABSE56_16380 [Bryobacteraceae bacterium]|jgi:hypothetical protein
MPRFELKKSIEVNKLNKRTGFPTGDLPTTIPFGAIIDDPELAWDYGKFTFQGQLYRCASDVLQAAMEKEPVAVATPAPAAAAAPAAPAAAEPAEPAPSVPEAPGLKWETLRSNPAALRAKVPGGWLVTVYSSVAFYPDPDHVWDGTSLP